MIPVSAKSTITNTSSTDEAAIIICGIPFCVPNFSSINFNILGTTTAGDTAAITEPATAASIGLKPKITGHIIIQPKISNTAGTQHIIMAGLPTFFNDFMSRDSPARRSIIISAVFRKSADMESIVSLKRLNT